jgi:hypothetical protein
MARGQHDIWPVPCFNECRLSLSKEGDDFTVLLLGKLRRWPWIGRSVMVLNRPLRIFSTPPAAGGYALVFDVTATGVVRPVLVVEGIRNEEVFVNELPVLIDMVTQHATMVEFETLH